MRSQHHTPSLNLRLILRIPVIEPGVLEQRKIKKEQKKIRKVIPPKSLLSNVWRAISLKFSFGFEHLYEIGLALHLKI